MMPYDDYILISKNEISIVLCLQINRKMYNMQIHKHKSTILSQVSWVYLITARGGREACWTS